MSMDRRERGMSVDRLEPRVSTDGGETGIDLLWDDLIAFGDAYTCYSAAVASWVAHEREDWASVVDSRLALTVFDAGDGLFGFAHFPPQLRAQLGLARMSIDGPHGEAVERVLAELERNGRVIVAGDGMRLPWHVAHAKRHVPHWYVISGAPDRLEVIDPFACRNELGTQQATRLPIARAQLADVLPGLPGGDPVLELRERLALGDDCGPPEDGGFHWFAHVEVTDSQAPEGHRGADAAHALAHAMREHGQDQRAYRQVDDIWSIGRHRAFLARQSAAAANRTGDEDLAAWTREHAEPLAKRWSHMAPLLMQARLALSAGRAASDSVPSTLEELAEQERAAAAAAPPRPSAAAVRQTASSPAPDNPQPSVAAAERPRTQRQGVMSR